MVLYNFKTICVVPSSKDFIDVVLSKTQRKTPTVVHKGWNISRIRSFYMRKVKFTQENYNEKLTLILEDFPKMDDIHPFYADLINVLYSRDHYKLALGQLNTAKQLIDNVGKDYLKMLKFGDSLYRCKELKRAALGRMCTIMKKMTASLGYLEEVRQHLSRLPSIDPNTRTLMITGYPNVGKSSFINKVSRADVEVQPYAFTTKSLFVGHCDYKYMRWQVLDTPGILDHPLEDRNTIEMQAVTALAHLHSTVLYFIDISETCGYSIKQQVSLYHNIKPLFANKPLLVVANKIDLKKWDDLDAEDIELINSVVKDRNTTMIQMSNVSEEGVDAVKTRACDMLLEYRVSRKLKSKRIDEVINRIHVAKPVKRDNKDRGVTIPPAVLAARARKKAGMDDDDEDAPPRRTEKDAELEQGGPGVYQFDHKKLYQLPADWKYDVIPEIILGKNIADFVDPDIDAKLADLEREEEEQEAKYEQEKSLIVPEDELDETTKETVQKIRDKRKVLIAKRIRDKTAKSVLPRTAVNRGRSVREMGSGLEEMGLDASKYEATVRGRSRTRKRARNEDMEDDDDVDMSTETGLTERKTRSKSRGSGARDASKPRDSSSYRDPAQEKSAKKKAKLVQKMVQKNCRSGEADRRVMDMMPKHLNTGKRGIGKTDRR